MNDKEFSVVAIILAVGLFILWLYKRHQTAASTPSMGGALPENLNWPMDSVSPQTYTPPTVGQISLNVQNPGFNMLSNQYIPLFGFVGMAQGGTYE